MANTLSVYFNIDRTYMTLFEQKDKGLELIYVDATRELIDLENPFGSEVGIAELKDMIAEKKELIKNINITLPAESVFVTQFPGQAGMSKDQLEKLVNLEIKQAFPQFNTEDFISNIIPMVPTKNGDPMMLACIMQKEVLNACKEIFDGFFPIMNIEISQLNAHTAFLYNYPEKKESTVLFMGIQEQFIDVSVLKNGKPAYYNLLSFSEKEKLGEYYEEEYKKLLKDYVDKVDAAYFFGTGLTKELYIMCWETSMMLELESGRLNAFRMVTTQLEQRYKDYCSRMMHVFPPCVGGNINSYHDLIRL